MVKTAYFGKYSTFLIALLCPSFVFASLEITEIMYDLPGTDTGREWIEIKNISSAPVQVTNWRFREGGTGHGITAPSGPTTLSAGAYAIVADNHQTFRSMYPSYTGLLFDSAFSLSNEGELLELLNESGVAMFSASYSSGFGAQGDGNSLNKIGSTWTPRAPSPGGDPSTEILTASTSAQSSGSSLNTLAPLPGKSLPTFESQPPQISLASYMSVFTGQPVKLSVTKTGYQPSGTTYSWSFGDGSVGKGETVYHPYRAPGTYVAVVEMKTPRGEVEHARTIVTVNPFTLILRTFDYFGDLFAEITNNAPEEIDLKGWSLVVGAHSVNLPSFTIVLPGSAAVVPMGIKYNPLHTVVLRNDKNIQITTNKEIHEIPPVQPSLSREGEDVGSSFDTGVTNESPAYTLNEEEQRAEMQYLTEQARLRAQADAMLSAQNGGGVGGGISGSLGSNLASSSVYPAAGISEYYDPYYVSQGASALLALATSTADDAGEKSSSTEKAPLPSINEKNFFQESRSLFFLITLFGIASGVLLYRASKRVEEDDELSI